MPPPGPIQDKQSLFRDCFFVQGAYRIAGCVRRDRYKPCAKEAQFCRNAGKRQGPSGRLSGDGAGLCALPASGSFRPEFGRKWLHKVFLSLLASGSCRPVNREKVARFSICLRRSSSQPGKISRTAFFQGGLNRLGMGFYRGRKKDAGRAFPLTGEAFA